MFGKGYNLTTNWILTLIMFLVMMVHGFYSFITPEITPSYVTYWRMVWMTFIFEVVMNIVTHFLKTRKVLGEPL